MIHCMYLYLESRTGRRQYRSCSCRGRAAVTLHIDRFQWIATHVEDTSITSIHPMDMDWIWTYIPGRHTYTALGPSTGLDAALISGCTSRLRFRSTVHPGGKPCGPDAGTIHRIPSHRCKQHDAPAPEHTRYSLHLRDNTSYTPDSH